MLNKIILYASVKMPLEQAKSGFNNCGLNGDKHMSMSQDKVVVLCQTSPFFCGCNEQWLEVKFEKAVNEIYVDIDDCDYNFDELDNDEKYLTTPWSQLGIDLNDPELGQYGVFVYEVKPDEILQITEVHSDDNDECFRKIVYSK